MTFHSIYDTYVYHYNFHSCECMCLNIAHHMETLYPSLTENKIMFASSREDNFLPWVGSWLEIFYHKYDSERVKTTPCATSESHACPKDAF